MTYIKIAAYLNVNGIKVSTPNPAGAVIKPLELSANDRKWLEYLDKVNKDWNEYMLNKMGIAEHLIESQRND